MAQPEHLIPKHGGYKRLVTYKLGCLIYDATVAFCERYIDRKDRTFDQMVQAARSGVANIVEGCEASATSKKTELKLTNVAKASQEELLFDYQAFLRQRNLPEWAADSPGAIRIRQARCEDLTALRGLMAELVAERQSAPMGVSLASSGRSDQSDKSDSPRQGDSLLAEIAANTMIVLVNQKTYLLARQIERFSADFVNEGGFTERLYNIRKKHIEHKNE